MAKVRRGDTVEVIAGREKGTRGDVLRVLPKEGRLVVQGVNLRKKHQRQIQAGGRTMSPGIIQFEAPINISNVMFVCPSCNERTRLSIHREDGKVRRYCKKCDSHVDS
ncbi:MAG: 50S ribosomal protein L24 [Chloroflexi bacterium]|nr:50S ribosomal protein L24 [Chloroflexota bacterium]